MITGITFWLIVIMANLVVLGLGTTEGLALSFGAFILSGHAMHEQEAAFLIRPYWKWG